MNERIKLLRQSLNMTQAEFANRLGIKAAAISNYEIGRNEPIDAVISLIVREFGVSEIWLRTGAGEMYVPRTRRQDIAAFMGQLLSGPEDFKTRLISVLANLDDEQWALLADIAEALVAEEKEKAGQD